MTLYSEAELGDAPEQQYTDSFSPPLLLFFAAVVWLVWAEARWFGRQHAIGLPQAVVAGIGIVALAISAALAVAVVVTLLV